MKEQILKEHNEIRKNISRIINKATADAQFRNICLQDGYEAYRLLANKEYGGVYSFAFVESDHEQKKADIIYLLPEFIKQTWLD